MGRNKLCAVMTEQVDHMFPGRRPGKQGHCPHTYPTEVKHLLKTAILHD